MAKQISQQTFDDVVRENMSEFDMDASEAVQDAIQQFESQGVNLNCIVKEPSLYSTNEDGQVLDHPVTSALKKLSVTLDNSDINNTQVVEALKSIQTECDSDFARRCLAGSSNAYPILYKALLHYRDDPEHLKAVLKTFCSLVNGQPDLIDDKGIELLICLFKNYQDVSDVLKLIIRAIRLNCLKHEKNRQEFIQMNLIPMLTDLLTVQKSNPTIIKESCICLRSLTLDDDVRVLFGKGSENAKSMVSEGDALRAVLQLCEEYKKDTSVLAELFLTLSCLAIRDEFCHEVMDRGGVTLILNACRNAIEDKNIVRQAMIVLKTLAGNDEVKHEIAKLGGIELIVAVLDKYQNNALVAEAACKVLTTITLRNEDNCRKVVQCQGHEYIVQVMKLHPKEIGVQKNACMALRNLVSRTKELTESILPLGVESLLNEIINHHKEIEDEAKAALRDLGCKVELRELWKGEKGVIQ
ncbi:unnamed protein product [Candidula unifasciata]|uniref:Protein zer-1 homolog-like C-terminal domain-containing protein n=1 Tax=Candidula unifasciata TaxID=100452 RepID=A0A8S3YBJ2_9EUPU|nr:unnamed protein product [Candidula unifasciata]